MASITKRSAGYLVQVQLDGERKSISFPNKYSRSEVEEFVRYVDKCVFAIKNETPLDRRTLGWIDGLSERMRKKLERAGIIEVEKEYSLQDILDEYTSSDDFAALKSSTQNTKQHSYDVVFKFFDRDTKINDVSKKDARSFAEWLSGEFAQATKATVIRDLRRAFNWAMGMDIIDFNPFAKIKKGSYKNKSREHYVSMEDYQLILDQCQTQEDRVALALYRIGGLRKSEAFLLNWSDVDFKRGRVLVHSPKTEHFEDRDTRTIPLFPELRKELERLYERGIEGLVISSGLTSFYSRLKKAIKKAGLKRWERLIQNLRSSRAIDVYRKYGALAEKEWIGHAEQTARDHYLHLLEEDFQNAIKED